MRRTVVDPRFGARLRKLRTDRGRALRDLAKLSTYGKSYIHQLEIGTRLPSTEVAQRLDAALEAGGALACLVYEPAGELRRDDDDRLAYVADNPRRIDRAAVDALAQLLADQRRAEDTIGSAPLVRPALARLAMVTALVEGAPDDDLRPRLVDVAGQWAQFAGWLTTTTGDLVTGRAWYIQAMEWAAEAGNPHMVATALSMRGHQEWIRGQYRAMIELSRAAVWQPASRGVRALALQQEARGLALVGDAAAVDTKLDQAEEMAAQAAQERDREPPWMYFYDPDFFSLQRGLAQRYLLRHDRAAELLTAGLDRLPPDIRRSDWIGWYICQLAAAHGDAGNDDCAATALDEARQIVTATGAARLGADVDRVARRLGL